MIHCASRYHFTVCNVDAAARPQSRAERCVMGTNLSKTPHCDNWRRAAAPYGFTAQLNDFQQSPRTLTTFKNSAPGMKRGAGKARIREI
jgi:hypothetical protein